MKRSAIFLVVIAVWLAIPAVAKTQVVNTRWQSWWSVNTTARLSRHWGLIIDLHERRNDFLSTTAFHFARGGVQYWFDEHLTVAGGYGHLWLAPSAQGWHTISDENRLFVQAQWLGKVAKLKLQQRLRIEERWQEKIADDKPTGNDRITTRYRYLTSFTMPVGKGIPSLVVSDELLLQSGKETANNFFDQNRFFVGLKHSILPHLSADMGYMYITQRRNSGAVIDHAHILRLFLYFTPDFTKH